MPPARTRIKICGMTSAEDALAAAALGADAVGFVFAPSPRRIEPSEAREIVRALPPFVTTVAVFVDASAGEIAEAMEASGCRVVQLHGSEPPVLIEQLRWPAIKALRVREARDVEAIPAYSAAAAILLDAYVEGRPGGTGATFEWALAAEARRFGRPIILAGGLNAENVAAAIAQVRPFGVDVSSGVEARPGKKDHDLMARFVEAVRRVDHEIPRPEGARNDNPREMR